ncbi:hypothetical protein HMPREF0201_00870 [Cedecea davisae DSM 4568]|uniref:Uncharacterized protein n=1 Tax=Cedecea davisae DSM 4568 TaxID=566551 RepID=S3JG39_9ENTR|nr:hypothetical protein HMPREF0201_00870 [Cedecea davisae DSM 4568]
MLPAHKEQSKAHARNKNRAFFSKFSGFWRYSEGWIQEGKEMRESQKEKTHHCGAGCVFLLHQPSERLVLNGLNA